MLKTLFSKQLLILLAVTGLVMVSCKTEKKETKEEVEVVDPETKTKDSIAALYKKLVDSLQPISDPLVTHIYTADPSAHVFNDTLYIYPSHDWEAGIPQDDLGSHFDMKDYHVLSLDSVGGEVTDHGVALDIKDVPWAGRQMWAPDAAEKDGKYFLYFPVKDTLDIFRIGAAVSDHPAGPFKAEDSYIEGSFSMDPAVYKDTDGTYYMAFGGSWGGHVQLWPPGDEGT